MNNIFSPQQAAYNRVMAKEHAGDYSLPEMSQQPSWFGNMQTNLGNAGSDIINSLASWAQPQRRQAPTNPGVSFRDVAAMMKNKQDVDGRIQALQPLSDQQRAQILLQQRMNQQQ